MAEYAKIYVDQDKKLVKIVWTGKPDYTGIEEGSSLLQKALMSFKKGEPLCLADVRNVDMRFLPPGADKVLQEAFVFVLSHCKKTTNVVSSIMLEKQLEKTSSEGNSMSNFKIFDSEQEAVKWLLE